MIHLHPHYVLGDPMKRLLCGLALVTFSWLAGLNAVPAPRLKYDEIRSIIRAEYGAPGHWTDVTWLVANKFDSGGINFKVSSEVLGGDPAPGAKKKLRLSYRRGWFDHTDLVFDEGESVRFRLMGRGLPGKRVEGYGGTAFPALSFREWTVEHAEYGGEDVTKTVRGLVKQGHLRVHVSKDALGSAATSKSLQVLVIEGLAGEQVYTFKDGEDVDLLLAKRSDAPAWHVAVAEYGAPDRFADVTQQVAGQLKGDAFNFLVGKGSMLVDPAPRLKKVLRFRVQNTAGKSYTFQFDDRESVRITLP